MPIELFNTLTSRKESFQPARDAVTMYVCGLTPKNHPHIGHAWLFVSVDVMRRYLEFSGLKVRHVQNFTDVDDKIIEAGHRDGISPEQAAARYVESYWTGMDALNVLRPTNTPYATQYVPQMIEIIQGLIDGGYAYPAEGGDVYYRVQRFPAYGRLSGNTLDKLEAGARIEPGEHKESPADFALWKAAKPGEPHWDSPWSAGRPGWHIECSTMIHDVLGETIDVHWGGRDLIFPHHENEIAQSEAYTGKPFVRHWMHVGLMQIGSEKMAHSLGNFVPIHDMIREFGADTLRMYLVSEHYRTPVTFTTEYVGRAADRLKRLRSAERNLQFLAAECAKRPAVESFATGKLSDELVEQAETSLDQFREAMDDDLTTPRAISAVEALAKRINTTNDEVSRNPDLATPELVPGLDRAAAVFHQLAQDVLGLRLDESEVEAASDSGPADDATIEQLVNERTEARSRKDFAAADRLRQELVDLGITIEDRPQGTIWYRQ